jgi:hypothetical protein
MYVVQHSAWTTSYEASAFYDRHPIGATTACYYSLKDPGFVSVSDSRDGLVFTYAMAALLVGLCFFVVLYLGALGLDVSMTDLLVAKRE